MKDRVQADDDDDPEWDPSDDKQPLFAVGGKKAPRQSAVPRTPASAAGAGGGKKSVERSQGGQAQPGAMAVPAHSAAASSAGPGADVISSQDSAAAPKAAGAKKAVVKEEKLEKSAPRTRLATKRSQQHASESG